MIFFFILSIIKDYIVVSDSEKEVILNIKPEIKVETTENFLYFSGERYVNFEPGFPDLPSLLIPIEINPEYEYSIEYRIKRKEILKGNFEVKRVPEIREDGLSHKVIAKTFKTPFPDKIILNEGISHLRFKPILYIVLFPVRITDYGIEIVKEIEIKLIKGGIKKINFKTKYEDKRVKGFYDKILIKRTEKEYIPFKKSENTFFEGTPLWLKIYVEKNGIYYLTYQDIKGNFDILPENLDIKKISLYTRLKALPPSPDSSDVVPQKIPFLFIDRGEKNIFDKNDTIIFVGFSGTGYRINGGNIEYYFHPYTENSIYYLSLEGDSGISVPQINGYPRGHIKIKAGIKATRHERNYINLAKAGLRWVGEVVKNDTFYFNMLKFINPLNETCSVKFNFILMERSKVNEPDYFITLYLNNNPIFQQSYSPPVSPKDKVEKFKTLLNTHPLFKLKVKGHIVIDFLEIRYKSELKNIKDSINFYIKSYSDEDILLKGNFMKRGKLFKILSPFEYYKIENFIFSKDSILFNPGEENDTFMIMYSERLLKPILRPFTGTPLKKIQGADMLIIGPGTFKNLFSRYIYYRKNNFYIDTFKVQNPLIEYININDIFEEFGYGIKDPVAIRNYLKYTFLNYNPCPFYVLLAGKGTYDFKNYKGGESLNLVPPYEWGYGVDINNPPYTYDDFFVEFDGNSFDPDMVIGRIPAKNPSELYGFLERIINYEKGEENDMFKNRVLGVADDTIGSEGRFDGINHTKQATKIILNLPNSLDKYTLYMLDYPYFQGRKPEATRELLKFINRGIAFVYFFIHGNPEQLAHEELLRKDDLDLVGYNKKPSFILLGSCKTMNFDRPEGAIGEKWLMKNGIGALGSTYLTYPNENEYLIEKFFNFFKDFKKHTFGCASYVARFGNKDYVYLGDPSTTYSFPQKTGNFIYIPDTFEYSYFSDTSFKFYRAIDSLKVRYSQSSNLSILKIETQAKVETLYVRGSLIYPLYRKGLTLFRGFSQPKNRETKFKFFLPYTKSNLIRILSFNLSQSGEATYRDSVPVKPSQRETFDLNPPEINLSVDGRKLKNNDTLPSSFSLFIELKDESGINIATESITLEIGNLKENLNDFFYYKPGSHTEGFINYRLQNLTPGLYKLNVSAYDIFHNRRAISRDIYIYYKDTSKIFVKDIIPYPNPASNFTFIGFSISKEALVKLKIYTMRGVKVFETEENIFPPGFNSIRWKIDERIANGVYFFIIEVKDPEEGSIIRKRGKIIVYK